MSLPNSPPSYVGRFAPSPSGNLHFGSLITALSSYLQARTENGRWWLRVDDLDTPRNVPGATAAIQRCLEAHALHWDSIYYQSEHIPDYLENLQRLQAQRRVFACQCSRKTVLAAGGVYPGTCRDKQLPWQGNALRLRNDSTSGQLNDALLGLIDSDDPMINDDFILRRRDGIIGYHLASVTDDINMGVTQVVRGADLLLPSICQLSLYKQLDGTAPEMLHLPVACFADGRKLSKQNHAPELKSQQAPLNLLEALRYLGQRPPSELLPCSAQAVIDWALAHWNPEAIPVKTEINLTSL
ncbi:MAG: tRNA glutamyl-Q(34) synthetase GluQRS [Aestuariibacter sp.]